MGTRNIWFGLLLAPWITTLALLLASYIYLMATQGLAGFDDLEAGLAAGLICLGVAYASVLIFGVPTVWLLRRLERFDPIHICVISAVEGAMVLNVLAWTTGRRFSTVLWTAFVGAILGLITGVVVAVAGRPARSPKSLA